MYNLFSNWIEKRRQIRQRWQQDARVLIEQHGRKAYYEAQRLAARGRAHGNRSRFWHWAKVASEVARISPSAEMDMKIVRAIADEEMQKDRRP